MKEIILIDENDSVIGYGSKEYVHNCGILHRAFSVCVYSKGTNKILIQQRAHTKYHSGNLWSNSFCSHPREDEEMLFALNSRFREELGVSIDAKTISDTIQFIPNTYIFAGKFHYYKEWLNNCENEIDYVYVFLADDTFPQDVPFDKDEVKSCKWVDVIDFQKWFHDNQNIFTVWSSSVFQLSFEVINQLQ